MVNSGGKYERTGFAELDRALALEDLHGHHFQIAAINGQAICGAVRDTAFLTPMSSVTFAFDADNPGKAWPLLCHHLYHMASGMMTTVGYEGA